jgi:hypothetical protein
MQSRMIFCVINVLSICVMFYRVDILSVIVSFVDYSIVS